MSVCTCMFVYDIGICSWICVSADTCVGAHMRRTETDLCVFLNCFPSCSFEQGLSQTGWLISSKDPHDSEPPVIGPVSQLLMCTLGILMFARQALSLAFSTAAITQNLGSGCLGSVLPPPTYVNLDKSIYLLPG